MSTMKDELEIEQIRATINKMIAETAKIQAEAKWYPFVAAGAVFAAAIGVVKLFLN